MGRICCAAIPECKALMDRDMMILLYDSSSKTASELCALSKASASLVGNGSLFDDMQENLLV